MDSEDDDMYDSNVEDDSMDEKEGFDSDEEDGKEQKEQNYTILNEEDIRHRLEEDITRISTVLTMSTDSACILLRNYDWVVSKVLDAWFADEEKVRREVGLLEQQVFDENPVKKKQKLSCGICFDSYSQSMMNAVPACGHLFCSSCWTGYITSSINDGPGCLYLRCPDPSCKAAVGHDMIKLLASDEDKQKYEHYLLRSYVENSRKIKWCPAPDCNFAVDFVVGSENYDVSCKCRNMFCWNCTEDAHRPVDCSTVAKWIAKNSSESENTNWILVNSKPCPKCKRPIEKNHGCMHMVCTPPCKFHFCWLCLGAWSAHGAGTGGFYACNGYEKAKREGTFVEEEKKREMVKNSLKRYTHYYERWAMNHKSRQKAITDFKLMQSVDIEKLRDKQCMIESQMQFISEALLQIIECRRVLKWTYAYGYYLPVEEHTKRQLFEYLQGQAESGLERLHQCAEKELQVHLKSNGPSDGFLEFRKKLGGLTSVTRNYFENLVRALENGLPDVDSLAGSSRNLGVVKNKGGKAKGKGTRVARTVVPRARQVAEVYDNQWLCGHCTYANQNMTSTDCQMCGLPWFY